MKCFIWSCPPSEKPQFATLNNRGEIFSYHLVEYDAMHNASILNGSVIPIDWVEDEMIIPIKLP